METGSVVVRVIACCALMLKLHSEATKVWSYKLMLVWSRHIPASYPFPSIHSLPFRSLTTRRSSLTCLRSTAPLGVAPVQIFQCW